MDGIELTHEVFKTLKEGDILFNINVEAPSLEYKWEVVTGYHIYEGEGCIEVSLIYNEGKSRGQACPFYEHHLDSCNSLYKKIK